MRILLRIALLTSASILFVACGADSSSPTGNPNGDFSIGTNTMCSSSHSLVGSTANFSSNAHSVAGTLTVIDDCTLEISNFSYDGGGPAVFFYTGNSGDYSGSSAKRISKLLTGTAFSNNTVTLVLPNNITLDDFDGVSVWCIDFMANFGDARL